MGDDGLSDYCAHHRLIIRVKIDVGTYRIVIIGKPRKWLDQSVQKVGIH